MIFIGADHRGYEKKSQIITFLEQNHYDCQDLGAYVYSETDDFNDSAIAVAKAVRETPKSFGILICGSAHGMVIQANRFKGVRAIEAHSEDLARMGREHNDANVLCLSADFLEAAEMEKIIKVFLNTNFNNGEKYLRRIKRLDEREDYA